MHMYSLGSPPTPRPAELYLIQLFVKENPAAAKHSVTKRDRKRPP